MNSRIIHVEIYSFERLDKLMNLTKEYSLSLDYMVNVSVKRLLNDIEDVRSLRENTYEL